MSLPQICTVFQLHMMFFHCMSGKDSAVSFVWQKCKQLSSCLASVLTFAVKYLLYLLDSEKEMTANHGRYEW